MKIYGFIISTILLLLSLSSIFCLAQSTHYLTYEFQLIKELDDHKGPVNSIVFSPDGRFLASGSNDNNIKLWDAKTGKSVRAIMRHPASILCIAFSPDSNIIASGLESGAINLWDVSYKERIKVLKNHTGPVLSMRFSPDGLFLASGSADKTIRIWNLESGNEVKAIAGHTNSINSLAFSSDGKALFSGSSDGTIKVWDIPSGENRLTLKDSGGFINSISLSPDGKILASGLSDGNIKLWDLASRSEIGSLTGHKEAIGIDNCLIFSSDGRFLISASHDNRLLVWDTNAKIMLSELMAHKGAIKSIAFSPDGRTLASGAADNSIKLWKTRVTESLEITFDAEYKEWNRGIIKLKAEVKGQADTVTFQYSLDASKWMDIAKMKESPYSLDWDTRVGIPEVAKTVYLRVLGEKDTGLRAMKLLDGNFSVDNQPPKTKNDYDGTWRKEDFQINLSADDGDGIGLFATKYRINYGPETDVKWNEQPRITYEGMNTLEYWSLDKLGNEEPHNILSEIKLDKTGPDFVDWQEEPKDMPKDFTGPLIISVRVTDAGGSDLSGKTPQFDYRIWIDTEYHGYENMLEKDGRWYYEILPPSEGWDQYNGKTLFYKAKCDDLAGNTGRSKEIQKMIGSIKIPPTVKLANNLKSWEKGNILLQADASDTDGVITNLTFQYSLDGVSWTILETKDSPPYSFNWNTIEVIQDVARTAWIQIIVTDNDGLSANYMTPVFGIDNQKPSTSHDYDMSWRKGDFTVNLTGDDGEGSGIASIKYRLNNGPERDVKMNGQPRISENGRNTLEYWSVDLAGNEETHKILSDVKLDRLKPTIETWSVKKEGNILRVEIKVVDNDSGIEEAPQFDYRIGSDTNFSNYKSMVKSNNIWKYDIDISNLSDVSGKILYCKVNVKDGVGNLGIKTWEYEIGGEATATFTAESPGIIAKPLDEKTMDISTRSISKIETGVKDVFIIWTIQPPEIVKLGDKVEIQGRLEPKPGRPLPVGIKVIAPDDTIYNSLMDADLDGLFQFNLTMSSQGPWKVLAEWEGDREFKSSKSNILKFQTSMEGPDRIIKKEPETKAGKAGGFLKKNMIIIGLLVAYLFIIRLYRD